MSFGIFVFSFDFILDSRSALSLVKFNADCLSAVRFSRTKSCRSSSRALCPYLSMKVTPISPVVDIQEVIMKLVPFGLMSYDLLCFVFPTFWFDLSLPLAHPQTTHIRMLKEREICQKTMCGQHGHIGTIWGNEASHLWLDALDFDVAQVRQASPADIAVKVSGVSIDHLGSHFLHVVQSDGYRLSRVSQALQVGHVHHVV